MCEPVTAATGLTAFQMASLAFSAGGTLMSFVGQQQAAEAESQQLRYQAAVDNNNRILNEQLAEDAIARGEEEEREHRLKIGQLKGRQKTALASSGIEIDSGSALDILSDTAEVGELESLTIRNNAEREAQGFERQAQNYGYSSQNNVLAAENTSTAGNISSYSTLMGGAGSVSDRWYRYRKGI